MVWRAAVDGEARILLLLLWARRLACAAAFFASSEVRLVRRLGGARVVPFRCRWLLGPPDWVCEQFFGRRVALCELAAGARAAIS